MKYVWMSVIALLLLILALGCGSNGPSVATPDTYISVPGPPESWGEATCDSGYTLYSSGIVGKTPVNGYIWVALLANGSVQKTGMAVAVDSGEFSVDTIGIHLRRQDVPEGIYELNVYLAPDVESIGDRTAAMTEATVQYVTVVYPEAPNSCLEVLQGDSVYFRVVSGQFDTSISWDTVSRGIDQGYTWIMLVGKTPDPNWFVKLDSNGLFFPLKVTNDDSGLTWTICALNKYNPADTVMADVVVREPDSLGHDYNQYDNEICWAANTHGIPVALLKALVDQESEKVLDEFDTSSYRYEPYTVDYLLLSRYGLTVLRNHPYHHYNKQIPTGFVQQALARGDSLMSQDTIPAVTTYGGDVRDENGDGYFSGREYMQSVSNQGASWNHYCDVPADYDYVCQTPISASYGMIQVLCTTAIIQIKWS